MSNSTRKPEPRKKANGGRRTVGGSGAARDNGTAGGNRAARSGRGAPKNETGRGGRWFRPLEVALWVLVAGAVAYHVMPAGADDDAAADGTAPNFTLTTLNAGRVSLSHLRGDVVLVNFWATWCPPCRLEMPGFERVYRDYRDKGFTVVGLSTDEEAPGAVGSFIRQNGITYPVGLATDEMRRLYGGVDALPESFLVDKTGHVRKRVEGIFSESTLRREVDQLLAEGDE